MAVSEEEKKDLGTHVLVCQGRYSALAAKIAEVEKALSKEIQTLKKSMDSICKNLQKIFWTMATALLLAVLHNLLRSLGLY